MSQKNETISYRNTLIFIFTVSCIIVTIFVAKFIFDGLKADDTHVGFNEEAINLRLKPVGEVNTGEMVAVAAAPAKPKTAKEIYDATCVACHGSGVLNAPKFGDKAGWADRIAKGNDTLLKNAINGLNAMPPRGGNAGLSDEDVKRTLDYMLASVSDAPAETAEVKAAPATETPRAEEAAPAAEAPKAEEAAPAAEAPKAEEAAPAAAEAPKAEEAAPAAEAPKAEEAAPVAEVSVATTEEVTKLMSAKGLICMACHQVDGKMVGPSFKEVAQKYAGDASATASLATKITQGGAGVWGSSAMPPNRVADEDLTVIVNWILSLK